MLTEKQRLYIRFLNTKGLGPIRTRKLVALHGTLEKAAYAISIHKIDISHIEKSIEQTHTHVITQDDPGYPETLKNFADSPLCLFIRGNSKGKIRFQSDSKFLSIVGTRKYTPYGKQTTKHFAKTLSAHGYTIVSGCALGIDTFAHEASVEEIGNTVAVLGCGVNIQYPKENEYLRDKILDAGGLIMSEQLPLSPGLPQNFVLRNRIIAGLSCASIIVEGSEKSGAIITAKYAVEYGKEVFVIPGNIFHQNTDGPAMLARSGARVVFNPEDVLACLGSNTCIINKHKLESVNDPVQRSILDFLQMQPAAVDIIINKLRCNTILAQTALTELEIGGYIERSIIGEYFLKV